MRSLAGEPNDAAELANIHYPNIGVKKRKRIRVPTNCGERVMDVDL